MVIIFYISGLGKNMDIKAEVNRDINYLAGSHINRAFGTEGESLAGLYIRNRLQEINLPPIVEAVPCSKETFQIFSLYYIEFFFVVIFLLFLPIVGTIYGLAVTVFYLCEVFGIINLSQLISETQTQNIYTLIKNKNKVESPKILVIHTNYDAGISHPLYSPKIAKILPILQDLTFFCMLSLVITGFWAWLHNINPTDDKVIRSVIAISGSYLCWYGIIAFFCSIEGEVTRGANFNASGVAGALSLAKHFAENPLQNTDILFIFSGAHASWMAGLRHFLRKSKLPQERCLFVNLEGIGCGSIHVVTEEHFILTFNTSKKVVNLLENAIKSFGTKRTKSLTYPTSSFILLSHGYDSFTITGLDNNGVPSFKNQLEDNVLNINEDNIQKVVEFVKFFAEEWSR